MELVMQTELQKLKKTLFVDNHVSDIKFYPGSNRGARPEDFAREVNKFFSALLTKPKTMEARYVKPYRTRSTRQALRGKVKTGLN